MFLSLAWLVIPLLALAQTDGALAQRAREIERRVAVVEEAIQGQTKTNIELLSSVARIEAIGGLLALLLISGQGYVVLLMRNGRRKRS